MSLSPHSHQVAPKGAALCPRVDNPAGENKLCEIMLKTPLISVTLSPGSLVSLKNYGRFFYALIRVLIPRFYPFFQPSDPFESATSTAGIPYSD